MILSYLFFVIAYCLGIIFALVIAGIGGVVPTNSVWFEIVGNLFAQSSDLALRLLTCMIPFLALLNLNHMWFKRLLTSRPLVARRALGQVSLGTIIALPFLVLAVILMIVSAELTFGKWELFLAYLPILFVVPLLYMFSICTLYATHKKQFLARGLLDARLWVSYVLVILMLVLPAVSIINPFFKGYWTGFPLGELLDRVLRALSVSLIMPALPYMFARLSARTDIPTE